MRSAKIANKSSQNFEQTKYTHTHKRAFLKVLQNPVFALPGCQRINVNTLLCDTFRERKFSPIFIRPKFVLNPGVMYVRAFGSWMSAPKCLFFFQDFEGLTEVFAPDVRRDIRVDVCGISHPKTYSLGCCFIELLKTAMFGGEDLERTNRALAIVL